MQLFQVYAVAFRQLFEDDQSRWGTDRDAAFAFQSGVMRDLVREGLVKLDALRQAGASDGVLNGDRPLYVIAFPEWFFRVKADPLEFDPDNYYTRGHRALYADLLKVLSTHADTDVLLVGGSMLWIEPRTPEAAEAIRVGTLKYLENQERKHRREGKAPRPPERMKRENKAMEQRSYVSQGGPALEYLGYNESLVYFNGVQKKSVLKSANAGDFCIFRTERGAPVASHVGMVYGLGAGMFHLQIVGRPVRVSVAICYDHSRVLDYGKLVDIYVLVSCSQQREALKYVKDGGLIVHSDCRRTPSVEGGGRNKKVATATRAVIDIDRV